MKIKQLVSCFLFVSALGLPQVFAQETTNSSGGKATGTGTVDYSVGQTVYYTSHSETGSVLEGVQQPYEIFAATGIELITINLDLKVFPNPATSILTLKIDNLESELSYQLFGIEGKMLMTAKVKANETQIEMVDLKPSPYFLRVIEKDQIVKSFKIIKN